jgi:hypothetical protein
LPTRLSHQRRFTRKTVRKASDAYSITLSARAIAIRLPDANRILFAD